MSDAFLEATAKTAKAKLHARKTLREYRLLRAQFVALSQIAGMFGDPIAQSIDQLRANTQELIFYANSLDVDTINLILAITDSPLTRREMASRFFKIVIDFAAYLGEASEIAHAAIEARK